MTMTTERIQRLAYLTLTQEWGTDVQIDSENEFTELVEVQLGAERFMALDFNKATTEDVVRNCLEALGLPMPQLPPVDPDVAYATEQARLDANEARSCGTRYDYFGNYMGES